MGGSGFDSGLDSGDSALPFAQPLQEHGVEHDEGSNILRSSLESMTLDELRNSLDGVELT